MIGSRPSRPDPAIVCGIAVAVGRFSGIGDDGAQRAERVAVEARVRGVRHRRGALRQGVLRLHPADGAGQVRRGARAGKARLRDAVALSDLGVGDRTAFLRPDRGQARARCIRAAARLLHRGQAAIVVVLGRVRHEAPIGVHDGGNAGTPGAAQSRRGKGRLALPGEVVPRNLLGVVDRDRSAA